MKDGFEELGIDGGVRQRNGYGLLSLHLHTGCNALLVAVHLLRWVEHDVHLASWRQILLRSARQPRWREKRALCGEGFDDGMGRDGRGHERWVVPLLCLFKKKVRGDVEGREAESTIKRLQKPKPEFSLVQVRKVKLHDVRHGGEEIRERGLCDGHD